jgi:hypothetical protein
MADTPLTDAEVMALKPDPQPKPAEEKPAEPKKNSSFGDVPSYEDIAVKPNGTKGTVHARSKDGPPLDADGNLIKKTKKQQDEENRRRGREALDKIAKDKAAYDAKVAAEAAAEKARRAAIGIRDMVGVDIKGQVKVPVVGEKSSDPITLGLPDKPGTGQVSIDLSVDVGKLFGKKEGLEVGITIRADLEKIDSKRGATKEEAKSTGDKAKEYEKFVKAKDKYFADLAEVRDTAAKRLATGENPQIVNDWATSEAARITREAGKAAGEYAVWGPNGKPPPPKD